MSIIEFLDHIGVRKDIFPYWVEVLNRIYSERLSYDVVMLGGALGAGKSTISIIITLYEIYLALQTEENVYVDLSDLDDITLRFLGELMDRSTVIRSNRPRLHLSKHRGQEIIFRQVSRYRTCAPLPTHFSKLIVDISTFPGNFASLNLVPGPNVFYLSPAIWEVKPHLFSGKKKTRRHKGHSLSIPVELSQQFDRDPKNFFYDVAGVVL